ncbi:hypothetical protein [Streptomyces nigrescens]|uniref:hypothetical protein n=1 Tax=Streptomyces nigrescens TaxID=1920 RepID=UPI0036FF8D2B
MPPRLLAKQGQDVEDVLGPCTSNGFPHRLANEYTAGSYRACQRRPAAPVRWNRLITERTGLVFSRTDALLVQ